MSTTTKRITKFGLLVAVVVFAFSGTASAQRLHGGFGIRVAPYPYYFGGPIYDPLWGPYYPYGYGVYPYGAYPYVVGPPTADVRVEAVPKQAEVFVDGFYAGVASDFDGAFKRLHTTPGGHAITLYLPGYRTVTQSIYVRPDSTFKMNETMDKLNAGEVSAPPPAPVLPVER